MTQFKDKSARGEFVSASLFTYPALMAGDILLYDTDEVPVGDDQRQHIEITRDIAIRFNARYGDTFVVPEGVIPKVGARIMDLQTPTNKMSKSVDSPQGTVLMLDDPKVIEKKFKRAVTDNDAEVRFDREAKPGVTNLLEILAISTDADPTTLAEKYEQYGPLKADTAAAVIELLAPVQARYAELIDDRGELQRILADGAAKAQSYAAPTLARAQTAVGLR
jgi:tryptophanyl-tRNA synthetase